MKGVYIPAFATILMMKDQQYFKKSKFHDMEMAY